MNFLSVLKSCDIPDTLTSHTLQQLKDKYKFLGKYINKLHEYPKTELIGAIKAVKTYINKGDKLDIILDEEQLKVVNADPYMHSRVLAGAGSGKSTTIIYRIKHLLDNHTLPESILVLTFNVDACNSLKERIKKLYGFDIKLEIRTIDSFCAHLFHSYYWQINSKLNMVSVSEFVTYAEELLRKYGDVISSKYQFIFFDEFQDISASQFSILNHFAKHGCFLTVIGDDNQNIYQWRGSNNSFIINFDNLVPNCKTYKITTNYRSVSSIVDLANNSIKYNKNKVDKEMKANNNIIQKAKLNLFPTRRDKHLSIINTIIDQVNNEGYSYDDFAILSRNSLELKIFEEVLAKANGNKEVNIPYVSLLTDKANESKPVVLTNHVTITTLHRSKGLEWKTVFIIGVNDKSFPTLANDDPLTIEEERRLFYVGVTRAKINLHFMCDVKELPISRFIEEVYDDHVELSDNTMSKISFSKKNLFWKNEELFSKSIYSVTDIVKLIRGEDIVELRENNLIPDFELKTTKLFEKELVYNDDIKKNYFEADFGEFCDRVITRDIMLRDNVIYDNQCKDIINTIYLTMNEIEVYKRYGLDKTLQDCAGNCETLIIAIKTLIGTFDIRKDGDTITLLNSIVNKILEFSKKNNGIMTSICVRENIYPNNFLLALKKSLNNYCDPKKPNSEVLKDIYNVSLCGTFNDNRRRLVYRDIYNIFVNDFDDISKRMAEYVEIIKVNKNICKLGVGTVFSINDNIIRLSGEMDMVDTTNNTIIDFKCSIGEFKLEWLLQLLLYYALYTTKKENVINKLKIFNILKGEEYEIEISETYDCAKLIDFVKKLIMRERGIIITDTFTDSFSIDLLLLQNSKARNKVPNTKVKDELIEVPNTNIQEVNYMVFDTETTGCNVNDDSIVQLAYILYDENYKKIKEVNRYIKLEKKLMKHDAYLVHKIDPKMLESKGENFVIVFKDFLLDLQSTKYCIGHNVKFDIDIIKSNLGKYNFKNTDPFVTKTIECTGKIGTNTCKLKTINGRSKMPTLIELYKILFNKPLKNAHNALADVMACAECYFKLKYNKDIVTPKTIIKAIKPINKQKDVVTEDEEKEFQEFLKKCG